MNMAKKTSVSRTRPAQKNAALKPGRPGQVLKIGLLVVDGAKAQLYSAAPVTYRLTAIPEGTFKQATGVGRKSVTDRAGRGKNAGTQRRHAMAFRSDPHNKAETNFVKLIGQHINAVIREKQFDRLVLVAPPRAMSELRAVINSTAAKKIALEITHEWTKLGVREMAARLKSALGQTE